MTSHLPLLALVKKEFLQALRDRRVLFMLLGVPVLQLVLFGYAANTEFNRADTVVVDDDRTEESRDFLRGLSAEGTFAWRPVVSSAAAENALREGTAVVAVIVPVGFGRELSAGRASRVQALVDGSDPSRSVGATAAIEQYAARRSSLVLAARAAPGAMPPRVLIEPRLLYNPSLKSRLFMVPGTAASLLLVVTTITTAIGLTREREVGTMEQLMVTPLSPVVLMVGKMLPYAIFGLFDEMLLLIVGNVLFDVPIAGPLPVVFLGAFAYLVCTLGAGLLISTLARTQQQALMSGFFVILPAILLSGMMTPISSMPSWVVPITYVNPLRYFVELHRSVLLRGASLSDVAHDVMALAAMGAALLLFAASRFRRTLG